MVPEDNDSEGPTRSKPQILDARTTVFNASDKDDESTTYAQIIDGLSMPVGEKRMPTMLLYDERGLRLYDNITTRCPEYYLFRAEEDLLKGHAEEIVSVMHRGSVAGPGDKLHKVQSAVVELGAGSLRKTSHILLALSKLVDTVVHSERNGNTNNRNAPVHFNAIQHDAPITYYALDLERAELDRCLTLVSTIYSNSLKEKVDTKGIWGTYDDGLKFIADGGLGLSLWQLDGGDSQLEMDALRLSTEFGSGIDSGASCPAGVGAAIDAKVVGSPTATSDTASGSSLSDGVLLTPPSSPGASESVHSFGNNENMQGIMPLHFLFIGSSLGNFNRSEAPAFLKSLPLKTGDTLLLGLDHDNSKEEVELAYGDPAGITKQFIMNGLRVAGRVLGDEDLLDENHWEYAHWYSEEERRHIAYYKSKLNQTVTVPGSDKTLSFLEGELVNIEASYKYSDGDAYTLFVNSDLRPIMRWSNDARNYSLWLLERPPFNFPLVSSPTSPRSADTAPITNASSTTLALTRTINPTEKLLHAEQPYPFGIPSLSDFRVMWKAWDAITMGMIPPTLLFMKPIDLRHICLFYLGHIPAFLDIFLSRFLGEEHTEPKYFKDIFERGIDPHVDDPTQCHPHSEVPEDDSDWPTLETILSFRDRVRSRLIQLYEDLASGKRPLTRRCGRVLFMTFEHEAYHAETLLYMLLQASGSPNGTLPPPGFAAPPWEALAATWDAAPLPSSPSVTLGPTTVILGHDDDESQDELFGSEFLSRSDSEVVEEMVAKHEFGWDNEHPRRGVGVGEFRISWRPVSNGEYWKFWKERREKGEGVGTPSSWVEVEGAMMVRTLYGPLPMRISQHWPVLASYDDLSKYAQVHGGRLPTDAELRHFYDKFDIGFESGGGTEKVGVGMEEGSGGKAWGDVEDSSRIDTGIGAGANIGYRNWHPLPPTTGCMERGIGGKGHNGGVWEWTSTLFDRHEGYVQSELYPGFSADFFDGKHQVVLGGAYTTIPRQANRRSLRNYYQHNYPYAWIGGRIVYDN